MLHIRLSDEDRERLGCPEWLDIDLNSVTAREAAVMQRGFDLDGEKAAFPTPGAWRVALGTPPWSFAGWVFLVWFALRRAGITVPVAELDFDIDQLTYKGDESTSAEEDTDPEASPGKDDAPPPPPSESAPAPTSTP